MMGFLGGLLGSNKPAAPSQNTADAQVQAFIFDIHKYLNNQLSSPNARILELSFLDHSTKEGNRDATAKVQLFFRQIITQLENYQPVLNALHPQEKMFQEGKKRSVEVLTKLITDCRSFETNAPYYNVRVHDGTVKNFLNRTLRNYMATLELYLEKN